MRRKTRLRRIDLCLIIFDGGSGREGEGEWRWNECLLFHHICMIKVDLFATRRVDKSGRCKKKTWWKSTNLPKCRSLRQILSVFPSTIPPPTLADFIHRPSPINSHQPASPSPAMNVFRSTLLRSTARRSYATTTSLATESAQKALSGVLGTAQGVGKALGQRAEGLLGG